MVRSISGRICQNLIEDREILDENTQRSTNKTNSFIFNEDSGRNELCETIINNKHSRLVDL